MNPQEPSIALVGPMGVGKSTVGIALANLMARKFVDLDTEIEARTGRSIPEIFRDEGEPGFRLIERDVLLDVTNTTDRVPCICATGGGVVTTEACRGLLKQHWFVVFLDASVETLVERLRDDTTRPLLASTDSLQERIRRLYRERLALYDDVALLRIRVDDVTVLEIAKEICERVRMMKR